MAFPSLPSILAARDVRAPELDSGSADALLRIYAWMQFARSG